MLIILVFYYYLTNIQTFICQYQEELSTIWHAFEGIM